MEITPKESFLKIIIIATVLLVAYVSISMRLQMVNETAVIIPIRADATDYYFYALNLRKHHVYSRSRWDDKINENVKPSPDARRNPGYSIFLLPFVDEHPPSLEMVHRITVTQAIISALTVLIALVFFRTFLSWFGASTAAMLTALSPHLISANIYVLTETVFTFFLVLLAFFVSKLASSKKGKWAFAIGVAIACATLVRPTLLYFIAFIIPTFLIFFRRKKNIKLIFILVLGFTVIYSPWVIRNNFLLDEKATNTLALASIHKGMYPGFVYKDDPKSYGIPNNFDPEWENRNNYSSVFAEIFRRFKEDPIKHLRWYTVGKPIMFFSWDIVVGMGDIFVYPVSTTPYHTSSFFQVTHKFMRVIHWPLIALALLASILIWLPSAYKTLSEREIIIVRFTSLVFIYFLLVHTAGLPLPRYAIPLRPFVYGMAMLAISILIKTVKKE